MAQFHQDLVDAAAIGYHLLTVAEIRKRDVFNGMTENFEAWAFPFDIETANLGWDGLLRDCIASDQPCLPDARW